MAESRQDSADTEAHDVLAAEAFAVPTPDPTLRHDPVVLPEDPTGIPEPHDVLAAEEFPMPSPVRSAGRGQAARSRAARRGGAVAALGVLLGLILRRRQS
jgi:hypothetical protein